MNRTKEVIALILVILISVVNMVLILDTRSKLDDISFTVHDSAGDINRLVKEAQ